MTITTLILATCLAHPRPPCPPQEDLAERWNYLAAGWLSERQTLVSGDLSVDITVVPHGRVSEEPPYDLVDRQSPEAMFYRLVFDTGNSFQESRSGSRESPAIRWITRDGELHEWGDAGRETSFLVMSLADAKTWERVPRFQPRSLGAIGVLELASHTYADDFRFASRLLTERLQPLSVRDLEGGRTLWRFSVADEEGGDDTYCELTFNERAGFTIERAAYGFEIVEDSLHATTEISTAWSQISGCWVPVRCSEIRRSGLRTVESTLDWNSVNQAIEPSVFDFEAYESAQGMLLLDERLGRANAFIVDRIGDDDYLSPSFATAPAASRRTRLLVILGVNFLLLAGLMIVLFLRRRGQTRGASG